MSWHRCTCRGGWLGGRQARRLAKKQTKLLFKEETKRQQKAAQHGTNAVGQTVLFM